MEAFFQLDGNILLFIQNFIRNSVLDTVFVFLTRLGDGARVWLLFSVLFLIVPKTRKAGCISIIAILLSYYLNDSVIKSLFARPRPFQVIPDLVTVINPPYGYSFPSGHTASSFAAAFAFYRNLPKGGGIPALILASLIGLSRIYVGVHYPTDVLFGVLSGFLMYYLSDFLVSSK